MVDTMLLKNTQVEAAGFAEFNGFDHLCVKVPDGGFTVSCLTSEGKRVTFSFLPYKQDGAPQCIDIQYHDSGMTQENVNGKESPVFNVIGFAPTGRDAFDTRNEGAAKPSIVCLLMDNEKGFSSEVS